MEQRDLNDTLKRYLDLGLAFTQMTRDRVEELVRDLARRGQIPGEQAQEWVEAILDRSHQTSEAIIDTVRREVSSQVSSMSLASKEELSNLAARVTDLFERRGRSGSGRAAGGREAARRSSTRAAKGAKRGPAKRSTKAAGAKRAGTTKRSGTKKAAAKKVGGRASGRSTVGGGRTAKAAAKKSSARGSAAKKASNRRAGA